MNQSSTTLKDSADAVVMLTWSNWFAELRSNRYHYATRFSKILPVIFVQPDLDEQTYQFEATSIPNITVLHISKYYNAQQNNLLIKALLEKKVKHPILWIYNINFHKFIKNTQSVLSIYHGTEDYLSPQSQLRLTALTRKKLNNVLKNCDLLISVSDGVAKTFTQYSKFKGKLITIANGCDYKFYTPLTHNHKNEIKLFANPIVFYQGNIFNKLNYELLFNLATRMKDWEFRFCGKIVFQGDEGWEKFSSLKNVTYLGLLTPEEIRNECYQATVGIIPFTLSDWLIKRSFPLKTFEYLAAGLPVVTVPIESILEFSEVLLFAETVDEFENALKQARELRSEPKHLELRLEIASQQDYDLRFKAASKVIQDEILIKKQKIAQRTNNHALHRYKQTIETPFLYHASQNIYKLSISYMPKTIKRLIKHMML